MRIRVVTMNGEIKYQGDVGPRGPKGDTGPAGPQGPVYDDTEIREEIAQIYETIGDYETTMTNLIEGDGI